MKDALILTATLLSAGLITACANAPVPVDSSISESTETLSDETATEGTSSDRLRLPVPQLDVVSELPTFGEGVVFDEEGRLFVSSPFTDSILLIDEAGSPQTWAKVSNPNGHKVLADGTHVVMERAESGGAVVYLDPEGQVIKRITEDEEGQPIQEPNDVAVDLENGGFYFTAPGPFQGDAPGRVYYVDSEGDICTVSDGEIDFPNGIVLRPNGQTLIIGESLQNRVLQFEVRQPCELGPSQVFAVLPSQPNAWTSGEAEPDGMALDEAGNLYVAHFGAGLVRVFSPTGELLGSLGTGASSITNFAFSANNPSELYVYAANGNSLEELDEGGRIIRLTLSGVDGLRLIPLE